MKHTATVFLSCGQRDDERELAKQIEAMLCSDEFGLACYNADSVRGFDDVMSITDHLSSADYFLFVDFHRPDDRHGVPISVFSHQELALARAWGLDDMLAFQEEGLESYGMLRYVLAHPIKFKKESLLDAVRDAVKSKGWHPSYSRNLVATELVCTPDIVTYSDHTGLSHEKIWKIAIENRRVDRAAVNIVAILDEIEVVESGTASRSLDRSPLKWVGESQGYAHTILPSDVGSIDAFAVRVGTPGIFLHSRMDAQPRAPVVSEPGEYVFTYKFYAERFPMLTTKVRIRHEGPLVVTTRVEDTTTSAQLE